MADAHAKDEKGGEMFGDGAKMLLSVLFSILIFAALIFIILNNSSFAIFFTRFLLILNLIFIITFVVAMIFVLKHMFRFGELNKEIGTYYTKTYVPKKDTAEKTDHFSRKYEVAKNHLLSENEAEWRLAIIDADLLLFEALKKVGYEGESVGELLKNSESKPFKTLEEAWQAHKVRNKIAHDGTEFKLSKQEAEKTFNMYTSVFKDLGFLQ